MREFTLLVFLAAAAVAQQRPINLNFQENDAGGKPKSWVGDRRPGYSMATSEDCRTPKSRCVVLRYDGASDPTDVGGVHQSFDAAELRGKQIRYRAWVHVDDPAKARAQIFVRVDRQNGTVGFHDYSHDRPVRSRDWTMLEVAGKIDADAVGITIGVLLGGRGAAYFADQEFERVDNPR